MAESWFLLFNTQRAGVEWLCDIVRNFSNVAVRLNINALDEPLSLRGKTIRKIETVKYRPGHERITTHPLEFGPADHFMHVEDNTDTDVIAMMDVYSVNLFLNVLADYPTQAKILRSKIFRCSALIMNPIKAIDSNVRRIAKTIKAENGNALDLSSMGQTLYPHDYDLSWAHTRNQYPAISCEKMFSYDLDHMLLKGPKKSQKPFNVAVRRKYMGASGADSFATVGHRLTNLFSNPFREI